MNKYNGLLKRAADEYCIARGKTEDEGQWKMRIIYSILGRMALASLYDVIEDDAAEEEASSIIHMKRRIETLAGHYKDMYPELGSFMPMEFKELSEEIYDIYLNTGVIYHEPNRIVMAAKTEAIADGIKFTRGYEIDAKQMASGLGTYTETDLPTTYRSLTDMYQLEQQMLSECWRRCIGNANWQEFHYDGEIRYLRMAPPFTREYWVDKPNASGKESLLRAGYHGVPLYYLYKVRNGQILASQLPQWQGENHAYRSLANACLYQKGTLPPSTYHYDGDIVDLQFKYLPPPAELYLWKLYTWPSRLKSLPSDFRRICARPVFEAIRSVMQQQEYKFTEE